MKRSETEILVADVELSNGAATASSRSATNMIKPTLKPGRCQAARSIRPFTECQNREPCATDGTLASAMASAPSTAAVGR